MRIAIAVDKHQLSNLDVPQVIPGSSGSAATVSPTVLVDEALSICVVCCSTPAMPDATIHSVANAMASVAVVRKVVLSEGGSGWSDRIEVIAVPHGTKLSKLQRLSSQVATDLVCICDPDLAVDEASCRLVIQRVVDDVRAGHEVVAFGIVDGQDDGTLLSGVIAIDKWLSHRILRRFLWASRIGITLPGQFLIVSASLLDSVDSSVDSYLDDLYLGWLARQRNSLVHRVGVVVGQEEPRQSWGSLLTQRIRWMRGLAFLFRELKLRPSALMLLGVHYIAYHGLPIFVMAALLWLAFVNPIAASCCFFGLAALLAYSSGKPFITAVFFLGVFPVVHTLATLFWWVPLSHSTLAKR